MRIHSRRKRIESEMKAVPFTYTRHTSRGMCFSKRRSGRSDIRPPRNAASFILVLGMHQVPGRLVHITSSGSGDYLLSVMMALNMLTEPVFSCKKPLVYSDQRPYLTC